MDLEHRVAALEQELQILKNQIQATLLDIREHLLNNTYPALKAEEVKAPASSETPPVPMRSTVALDTREAARPPAVRQVSLDDEPEARPAPRGNAPRTARIQQVDLEEPEEDAPAPRVQARQPGAARRVVLDEVEESADDRVEEMPRPKTARRARRSEQEMPAVQRPVALEDPYLEPNQASPANGRAARPVHGEGAPGPVMNKLTLDELRGPIPDDPSQDTPLPFLTDIEPPPDASVTEADWISLELLEGWVSRRLDEFGPRRTQELIHLYAEDKRFDPKTRDALLQLVSIIASEPAAQPGPARPKASPPAEPYQREADVALLHEPETDAEADQPTQHTILKLIAGIQNAGIGGARKKRRG